jgi:hypothetical protein
MSTTSPEMYAPKEIIGGGWHSPSGDSTVVAFFYGRGVDRFAVNLKSRLFWYHAVCPRPG